MEESDKNKGRSFVKRINKRGPSIEPCGTPQDKLPKSDV